MVARHQPKGRLTYVPHNLFLVINYPLELALCVVQWAPLNDIPLVQARLNFISFIS